MKSGGVSFTGGTGEIKSRWPAVFLPCAHVASEERLTSRSANRSGRSPSTWLVVTLVAKVSGGCLTARSPGFVCYLEKKLPPPGDSWFCLIGPGPTKTAVHRVRGRLHGRRYCLCLTLLHKILALQLTYYYLVIIIRFLFLSFCFYDFFPQ